MIRGLRVLLLGLAGATAVCGTASAGSYSPPPGDSAPVWSPDGSAIVYLARWREPGGLRVMNPDGSGDRLLPLPAPGLYEPPSFVFSPDWFWVAFGGRELVVSRPDGSQRKPLADITFGSRPAWSPNGRTLAFARADGIYSIGVDGSSLQLLTPHGRTSPAWSPDGGLIAFTGGAVADTDVLVVRPDGSGEANLTGALPGMHRDPVWSPDGSRLAVHTNLDAQSWRVSVLSRDGALIRQFAPALSASSLAWSPDGQRLLLSSSGVFALDVESGGAALLSPFGAEATWSSNGQQIAFSAGGPCKDRQAIYRMRVPGGRPIRLTNDCRVLGTSRADRLRGTDLADILLGLGGDDRLVANDGAYVADDLYGGPGDDALLGDLRGDRLEGGPGRDRLDAGPGPDFLRGGPGRDVLRGEGGKDQIRAEDGARDRVSCGTNRLRGTGPELDTAYVDRRDVVSADCELLYRGGRADLRAGSTALTIRVGRGAVPHEPDAVWRLRCNPAGGTLPHAGRACRLLTTMIAPLAPVSPAAFCARLDFPEGAAVSGIFAGKPVVVPFHRYSTCEAARWDRHAFLLEPR